MGLALAVCAGALLGCEALEPEWSETRQVSSSSPWAQATCEDICDLEGSVCLEQSCGVGVFDEITLAVDADNDGLADYYSAASCDDPLDQASFVDPAPWTIGVSCCCAAGY